MAVNVSVSREKSWWYSYEAWGGFSDHLQGCVYAMQEGILWKEGPATGEDVANTNVEVLGIQT